MNIYVGIPQGEYGDKQAIWDYLDRTDGFEPIGMIYTTHSNAATDWAIERDRDFLAIDFKYIVAVARKHIGLVVITTGYSNMHEMCRTGLVFEMDTAEDDAAYLRHQLED